MSLRVLIVEDNPADVRLIVHSLEQSGLEIEVILADSEPTFLHGLLEEPVIILCDYSLPQFDALRALDLLHERQKDIPLLIVSGSIGEEVAVEAMKRGAADYLLKDRLGRLALAVQQAIDSQQARATERRASALLARDALLLSSVRDAVIMTDSQGLVTYWNAGAEQLFGYSETQFLGKSFGDYCTKDVRDWLEMAMGGTLGQEQCQRELKHLHPNGANLWIHARVVPIDQGFLLLADDITERKRAEEALRESETRYRQIVELAEEGIWTSDPSGNTTFANAKLARMLGYEVSEMIGLSAFHFTLEEDHAVIVHGLERRRAGFHDTYEARLLHRSGESVWVRIASSPILDLNGNYAGSLAMITDITERKHAEQRLQSLSANMPGIIYQYVLRHDGTEAMLYASAGCCELWEVSAEELERDVDLFWKMIAPNERERMRLSLMASADTLQPWHYEWLLTTPSGAQKWVRSSAKPQRLGNNDIVWDGLILDVSENKRAHEQILHNARHDPLTNLSNRTLLVDRITACVARAASDEYYNFAILYFDIDRFKVINDSLGHAAGDELLIAVANLLLANLGRKDLVARIGGDEFVVLLEEIGSVDSVVNFAERILNEFRMPILIEDHEMSINTSIGVVVGGRNYQNASDLLRDADIAMYRAKATGGSAYKIFDVRMHTQAVTRLSIETYLRRALKQDLLTVHYQPIVDLHTNRLVGVEALARLPSATQGFISPAEFIPVAEETGLIVPMDQWIFREACRQLVVWQSLYPTCFPLKVSINLSVQDLRTPNFMELIDLTLHETGIDGSRITLEITESMLIDNIERTIELLAQLKLRRIQISIDDFGTGYSSLSYLHRLPADSLKIDRSFVGRMEQNNRDYQIVSTIINLSNQLGLAAIAEGVETPQQLDWLRLLGCEFGQGYLLSKPVSARELEERYFWPQLAPEFSI